MPRTDQNPISYARLDNLVLNGINQYIGDVNATDSLKFSQCFNVEAYGYHIVNHKEDTIDAVRGANYYFHDMVLQPRGRNGITLKGGIKGATLENIIFEGHGKECDIELGMWCDYDIVKRPKTRGVVIKNCRAKDGKPLIIRCWYAEKPTIINSNVKILWWPPIVSPAYFILRKKGLLGKLKKVEASNLVIDPRER